MKNMTIFTALLFLFTFQVNTKAQTSYMAIHNGSWDSPLTWSPGGVPGELDVAENPGFIINISGDITVSNYTQIGGMLVFKGTSGSITIIEAGGWENGWIADSTSTGNAAILIPEGSLFSINYGNVVGKVLYGVEISNYGTITSDDGFAPLGGSVVDNHGVFDIFNDAYFGSSGLVDGIFNNYGTLRKSGGNLTSVFALGFPVNNYNGTIDVWFGTLSLEGPGTYVNGYYNANAQASLAFQYSDYTFQGTLTGSPEGEIKLEDGNVIIPQDSTVTFDLRNNGIEWTGCDIIGGGTMVIADSAVMQILDGPSGRILSGGTTILNQGTIKAARGYAPVEGSVLINEGLFDIVDNAIFGSSTTVDGILKNYGTIRKSGGFESAQFLGGFDIENYNSDIESLVGGMAFYDTCTFIDGTYYAASGANMIMMAGTWNLQGTLTGSPSGNIELQQGNVMVGGAGASINFQDEGIHWSGSDISGGGTLTIPEGALMKVTNGPSGRIVKGATTLKNQGSIEASGGFIAIEGSTIQNEGTLEITDNINFSSSGSFDGTFINSGTILKTGGTSNSTFGASWDFQNQDGTFDIQLGNLFMYCGGTYTGGMYNASDGASLVFLTGSLSLSGTLQGSPAGTVEFQSGNLITGPAGAMLDFQGTGFTWSGGILTGGNTITNGENSILTTIMGGSARFINGGTTLMNMGTVNATGNINSQDSGMIENHALFDIVGDVPFYSTGNTITGTFNNYGIMRKSEGTGTASWGNNWDIRNMQDGVIDAQSGTLQFANLVNNENAKIQGVASIGVPYQFTNDGITAPGESPGELNYLGDYKPSSTGVLDIELGGHISGTDYDHLAVSGDAMLDGTLKVNLVDGFVPTIGDSFEVLTTNGSVSGTFQNLEIQDELFVTVNVNSNNVIIVVDSIGSLAVGENTYPGYSDCIRLRQNYPNPFSSATTISFSLPQPQKVTVEILNSFGQRVITLISDNLIAGDHEYRWQASNFPAGYYYCRIRTGTSTTSRKMLLIK